MQPPSQVWNKIARVRRVLAAGDSTDYLVGGSKRTSICPARSFQKNFWLTAATTCAAERCTTSKRCRRSELVHLLVRVHDQLAIHVEHGLVPMSRRAPRVSCCFRLRSRLAMHSYHHRGPVKTLMFSSVAGQVNHIPSAL